MNPGIVARDRSRCIEAEIAVQTVERLIAPQAELFSADGREL